MSGSEEFSRGIKMFVDLHVSNAIFPLIHLKDEPYNDDLLQLAFGTLNQGLVKMASIKKYMEIIQ